MNDSLTERRDTASSGGNPPRKPRSHRIRLPARRSGSGTAMILLALIVLPSALLGFLSWRAIEKERVYSLERLRESYRHFARLAAGQIDLHLQSLESRWTSEIDDMLKSTGGAPTPADLEKMTGREPLIAGYYLLSAPTRTSYPPVPIGEDRPPGTRDASDTQEREHDLFSRLTARGEEMEYRSADYAAAIGFYTLILDQVSSPQLRAMAESYVGRAQLKDGDPAAALATFRSLLERHPEVRDLNRMYLRFLAQYQIAVSLEALGRDREALEALLELNNDLLKRSDAINTTQYSYYYDLIQTLAPRLLGTPGLANHDRFEREFRELRERSKKRLSDTYFMQLLDAELNETVIRGKRYSSSTSLPVGDHGRRAVPARVSRAVRQPESAHDGLPRRPGRSEAAPARARARAARAPVGLGCCGHDPRRGGQRDHRHRGPARHAGRAAGARFPVRILERRGLAARRARRDPPDGPADDAVAVARLAAAAEHPRRSVSVHPARLPRGPPRPAPRPRSCRTSLTSCARRCPRSACSPSSSKCA